MAKESNRRITERGPEVPLSEIDPRRGRCSKSRSRRGSYLNHQPDLSGRILSHVVCSSSADLHLHLMRVLHHLRRCATRAACGMILSNALVAQSAPPPIYSVCDAINSLQPLKDSRISVQGLLDPNRFLLTHSQCWVPGKPIPEPRAITLREARGTAPYAGLREVSGKAVEVVAAGTLRPSRLGGRPAVHADLDLTFSHDKKRTALS